MDTINARSKAKEWAQNSKDKIKTRYSKLPHYGKWIVVIIVLLIIFILIRLAFIHFHTKKPKPIKPIPVVVGKVKEGNFPVYVTALGAVTPLDSVTVRTQINGQLIRVLFKEGQMVEAQDLIAEIDPRPYLAQLMQFEGQLARDQAFLDNAKIDLERYKTLWKQDSVSEQTLATQEALVRQYEGIIKLDQGQIEQVKVNLIYTKIISPVSGRIGLRLVDPGNVVQTTDTNGIVVINSLQPISVIFTIPEDNIPPVVAKFNVGKKLEVEAYDRSQTRKLSTGKVLSLDNQIDPTTGTLKLRGLFDNTENMLFPNQFVNVRLLVDTLKKALIVPTSAIQLGAKGNYVFVVDNDNKVSIHAVTTLATDGGFSAVKAKIEVNQAVVLEGAENLKEGSYIVETDSNGAEQNNTTKLQNDPPSPKKLKTEPKSGNVHI